MTLKSDIEIRVVNPEFCDEEISMACRVVSPSNPSPVAPILFMLPGAGYNRRYFDLDIPGREGFSQAEYHAANGMVVIAMDHFGVGDSTKPASDSDIFFPVSSDDSRRVELKAPLTLEMVAAV
jgi:hypothetical protein